MSTHHPSTGMDEALELTKAAITRLLRHYRRLAIAVMCLGLGGPILALLAGSWLPLLGWLALLPAYGIFMVGYLATVTWWQQEVLRLWLEERLDLGAFAQTAGAYPYFPPLTIQGLLEMLPRVPAGCPTVSRVSVSTGQALMLTLAVAARRRRDWAIVGVINYTLGLGALAVALASWSWQPMLGLLLLPLVWGAAKLVAEARWRAWLRHLVTLPGVGPEEFCKLAANVLSADIPKRNQMELLAWSRQID